MRRGAAWLITLPIALAGVEAAHALANAAFGAPSNEGELFAGGTSGAGLVPICSALAAALVLLGLVGSRLPARAGTVALPFACLPPVAFVLLEVAEGILSTGSVPWDSFVEPTFLAGLVLQLPFALIGYLVARLLLRLRDGVRRLIGSRRIALPSGPPRIAAPRSDGDRRRAPRRGSTDLGRAPPRLAASG